MKKLLLLCLLPTAAFAQTTPNFTQGSMQATTTTTQTITETVAHEIYGGDYSSWSGTNVTPSADLSSFTIDTAGEPFQYEVTERSAGVIETIDITRDIDFSSTTTSLSVFSQ
jgi:hypothetical protein